MRYFHVRLLFSLLAISLCLGALAHANVIIFTSTTAPAIGPGEVPISLTDGANAPMVWGTLLGNISVSFSTPPSLDSLFVYTNGHPRIEAEDGSINVLNIVANGTFSDFLADVYGVYDQDRDHLNVNVYADTGVYSAILPMNIGADTSNYLTVLATNGERIHSISLGTDTDPARFTALRNVYFSAPQVPEPASLLLMGIPLLFFCRKRAI